MDIFPPFRDVYLILPFFKNQFHGISSPKSDFRIYNTMIPQSIKTLNHPTVACSAFFSYFTNQQLSHFKFCPPQKSQKHLELWLWWLLVEELYLSLPWSHCCRLWGDQEQGSWPAAIKSQQRFHRGMLKFQR